MEYRVSPLRTMCTPGSLGASAGPAGASSRPPIGSVRASRTGSRGSELHTGSCPTLSAARVCGLGGFGVILVRVTTFFAAGRGGGGETSI